LAYRNIKDLTEIEIFVYLVELYPEPSVTLWEKIKDIIQNSNAIIVL
jgi:hypothetical protein